MSHTLVSYNPHEKIRLGIIMNQKAKSEMSEEDFLYMHQSLPSSHLLVTQEKSEIAAALRYLLHEKNVNLLAICGGDGTMHQVLNDVYSRLQRDFSSIPPFMLLRGGTMNIVATHVDMEGSPAQNLRKFHQRFTNESLLGELPLKYTPLLETTSKSFGRKVGFIFGSCLPTACLELYEQEFGAGMQGMWNFIQEIIRGYMFKTKFWHQYNHLIQGTKGIATLDSLSAPYLATVASTVDIKLLGGWITGLTIPELEQNKFHVRFLEPMTPARLVASLYKLVFGVAGEGIKDYPQSSFLSVPGNFSLDGEIYNVSEPRDEVSISSSESHIPFVKNWL